MQRTRGVTINGGHRGRGAEATNETVIRIIYSANIPSMLLARTTNPSWTHHVKTRTVHLKEGITAVSKVLYAFVLLSMIINKQTLMLSAHEQCAACDSAFPITKF